MQMNWSQFCVIQISDTLIIRDRNIYLAIKNV